MKSDELSNRVIGCALEVHRAPGTGIRERGSGPCGVRDAGLPRRSRPGLPRRGLARAGWRAGARAGVLLLAGLVPVRAQLLFEAETVSTPTTAWVVNRDADTAWNLWSNDKDAHLKWSGGTVLRAPVVRQDRTSPEEGAPPLHTVIRDLPAGIYAVELKVGRVLGVSLDGTAWQRYTGGALIPRVAVAEGGVIEFWVDDRYAMEKEEQQGSGYYDTVVVHRLLGVAEGPANPGFETVNEDGTVADWTWWSRDARGGAVSVTGDVHEGQRALRLTYAGERDWACTNSARLAVAEGDELCLRAWIRGPAGGGAVSVDAVGYGAGKLVSWQTGRGRVSMNGTWREAKGYFRVPAGVDQVQVRFTGSGVTDATVDQLSIRPEKLVFPDRPKVNGWAAERVREPMGRGAVAVPRADGSVYVGWRLLAEDPPGAAFDVFRRIGDQPPTRRNAAPIAQTTDFVDSEVPEGTQPVYSVRPVPGQPGAAGDAVWAEVGEGVPFVRLALEDPEVQFQKVGVADLNGDGVYDYVLKQPHGNIDPWHKYWTKSPETYKIEAYLADGTFLWRNDLGWGIERGIWYSPYLAFDLTGDGRAEVAAKIGAGDPRGEDGRVTAGPEFVVVWDGMTGREIARAPWPPRDAFPEYNYASRNQIAIAFLDGRTPCLLTLRGTYNRMLVDAYVLQNNALIKVWEYDNEPFGGSYWGQGAHFTLCADIDGDGRDEVILGSAVLDDNGVPLWSTGRGHPDAAYLADITPGNPGLELAYVMETRQSSGGLNVVDARTGKTLWALDAPTRHVHGKGMCADIDPVRPGFEVYGADADGHTLTEHRWLFAADGTLLREGLDCPWGFGIATVYWDADLQQEIVRGKITDHEGGVVGGPIAGGVRLKADILGDWREELITSVKGELRIYTTTIPAMDRRVCLMQDPPYRLATAMNAMGYTQEPTLSYNPESTAPNLNLTFQEGADGNPTVRVVVSAAADRGLKGRLGLECDGTAEVDPSVVEVDVAPGQRLVKSLALKPTGAARIEGHVRARLETDGPALRTSVPILLAAGFLSEGILVQAEAFGEQSGGEVQIRDDKPGTMAKSISHWDDQGHALTWTVDVPTAGEYALVLRYCTPHTAQRRLTLNGQDMGIVALPNTGGFGTTASEWDHARAVIGGRNLALTLTAGRHTIRLENTDGQGCNLDYLALLPR
ncbi:MAG: hypothetical protein JXR77_00065 [Lentisphaeria bacterium]|nr:hypothetical protein [Lentisphaeria bacterium]